MARKFDSIPFYTPVLRCYTECRVSSDLLNYALTCYCRVEKSFNEKGVWLPLLADCDDVSITYI